MNVPAGFESFDKTLLSSIFSIDVIPGVEQDLSKIGINDFYFNTFKSTSMSLIIEFESPLYISNGETADKINIKVKNATYFEAKDTGLLISLSSSIYTSSLEP